jgi:hypothetical protein
MYTKKEILLFPLPPKEKTKEEIEDEIEADLVRFRYQTYQPNTSSKGKENDFLLQRDKSKEFDLIKKKKIDIIMHLILNFIIFHIYI